MKKVLSIGFWLTSLASMQVSAWTHRIINNTDYKVWVEVHYHGASTIVKSCRPDKLFIEPKQEVKVDAKACSIRTIVGKVYDPTGKERVWEHGAEVSRTDFAPYRPPHGYAGNGTFSIDEQASHYAIALLTSHSLALRHSLTNDSDKTVDVFMWFFGESMLGTNAEGCLKNPFTSCCRREKRGLKPGERVEWATGGCQIKRVRVVEQETGQEFSVNVRNVSINELKKVGVVTAGILAVVGAAAAIAVTGGAAGAALGGAGGAIIGGAGAKGAVLAGTGAVAGAKAAAGTGLAAAVKGAGSGAYWGAAPVMSGAAASAKAGAKAGLAAGTVAGGAGGAAGTAVGFSSEAKKVFANIENEMVAYGSTGWLFDGTMVGPVNGVTIYKK